MMQAKLGSLVGRSSGYIESLPVSVRRRVAGLKGIQKDHAKLEAEFQEEVLQLEKKYFAKFTPLYQDRAKIVNGASEPSEEQVKVGETKDEDDEDDEEVRLRTNPPACSITKDANADRVTVQNQSRKLPSASRARRCVFMPDFADWKHIGLITLI
jgi:phage host-nuclease inhibitor protein Gam